MQAETVIEFWFNEIDAKLWWTKEGAFDRLLAQRFQTLLQSAARGELYGWRDRPLGRLAEIIVLDQFSRNIHRGSAQAFANDAAALVLAQEALRANAHLDMNAAQQAFLFMPYITSVPTSGGRGIVST